MVERVPPFLYDVGERTEYKPLGHEEQVEHINAYICRPSFNTDKAVIVIHDILGWQFPDTRYMVDLVAAQGYLAICPDFFKGQPWTTTDHWADFADWLKKHDPTKVDRETDAVLKYLKEQYGAKKIGVVGFSWGGMAVHHLMLTNPELQTGVSFYGIIRNTEDRYNLLNPTFFIFGEKDHTISLKQITLLEEKLKQYCQVPYFLKVYPGQVHGFAQFKPDDTKPQDKPYIEQARKDMFDWIEKFV
ncbi:carboxymethylenebutenolidase homolog [Alligator mississippiensis]|nr:carboxymethylenebutenolidase homolog [Alligator sinensis]XP_006275711.1 carboxymethylenebutenolidase homolog [Alligator mississippiensis]XP_059584524.1 carboxymethylenebutenolidase homolog [Alligator mississippiensis]